MIGSNEPLSPEKYRLPTRGQRTREKQQLGKSFCFSMKILSTFLFFFLLFSIHVSDLPTHPMAGGGSRRVKAGRSRGTLKRNFVLCTVVSRTRTVNLPLVPIHEHNCGAKSLFSFGSPQGLRKPGHHQRTKSAHVHQGDRPIEMMHERGGARCGVNLDSTRCRLNAFTACSVSLLARLRLMDERKVPCIGSLITHQTPGL